MDVILRIISGFQQITRISDPSKHIYQRKNFKTHKIGSGGLISKDRIKVPSDRIKRLKTKVRYSVVGHQVPQLNKKVSYLSFE